MYRAGGRSRSCSLAEQSPTDAAETIGLYGEKGMECGSREVILCDFPQQLLPKNQRRWAALGVRIKGDSLCDISGQLKGSLEYLLWETGPNERAVERIHLGVI